ncbi:MAG: M24 family metallopeptidase, partial [Anaerolineales bacterium]
MIRLNLPAHTRRVGVERKSARELDLMRQAGRINAQALLAMRAQVRPGITTRQLDKIAEQVIVSASRI